MEKDLTKVTKYDKLIEASTWLIIVALIFGIQFLPNKILGSDQAFILISAIICFALIYYLIIYRYFSKSSRVYLKNIADIILIGVLIFSMKDYGQYFFALYFIPIAAAALSLEFINALLIAVVACLFVVLEMLLGSQGFYSDSMTLYQGVWQVALILFITIFCRFLANQIRQERTLKEEAEARNKALKEEAEKEKEFISLTSHQLYTPISIIRGFSSMLNNDSLGKLNEKQKDATGKIYNNSKRMVNLINELLAVSRIQTKSFKICLQETDVKKMAEDAVNEICQTKEKDSVTLETEIDHLEPVKIDSEKIRQVLQNLISNAIKYTSKGKIVLKINQTEDKTNFVLTDEGAGIRNVDKEKIFQPFFRGKNILELDNKGTGLGLYISKMIVEAHQGEIGFVSEEGKGSTFYFNIPKSLERVQ